MKNLFKLGLSIASINTINLFIVNRLKVTKVENKLFVINFLSTFFTVFILKFLVEKIYLHNDSIKNSFYKYMIEKFT